MTTYPRSVAAALAACLVALAGVSLAGRAAADTAATPPQPNTVSAQALPTWQIDGVGWAQVTVGTTVYVAGSFTAARPPQAKPGSPQEVPAANLFAYDIRTGNPVAGFSPQLNGQALALAVAPDQKTLYVGGDFTTVDGKARGHIAAFDVATGDLIETFAPTMDGTINGLSVSADAVYAGGTFNRANGVYRKHLAAFDADGQLRGWNPTPDDYPVLAVVVTPDESAVVIGGQLERLNGNLVYGQGAVDATTGESVTWRANEAIKTSRRGGVTSLSTDGTYVYGTSFAFGSGGRFEGPFALNPEDGSVRWLADCLGDTYSAAAIGDVVYSAGHAHNCELLDSFGDTKPRVRWQRAMAMSVATNGVTERKNVYGWDHRGYAKPYALHWWPAFGSGRYTGQYQGPWSVTGNNDYVAVAGEFPNVNGIAQQGLTRFAVTSVNDRTRRPKWQTTPNRDITAPQASEISGGAVQVRHQSAWDEDNENLTYELYRDPNTPAQTKVSSRSAASRFDVLPDLTAADAGAEPGTHTYAVRVTDPSGNELWSETSEPIDVSGAPSEYASTVLADGAAQYWRLEETEGDVIDTLGVADGVAASSVQRGTAGALTTEDSRAYRLPGTDDGFVTTGAPRPAPAQFSVETWVKTTSTTGGRVLGFSDAEAAASATADRSLYFDDAGAARFGLTSASTVSSQEGLNDGKWHHLVATIAKDRATLYVDGVAVDNAAQPSATSYAGHWRIGADTLAGWPQQPTSSGLAADVDEVAVYAGALTPDQIAAHFAAGGGQLSNEAPTAGFSYQATGLAVSFTGEADDPDGDLESYAWTFGDDATSTEANPSHTYQAAGSYPVTLTVTDDGGATATSTQQIVVNTINTEPQAAFEAAPNGLSVAVDASGSTDADGQIASYAWDFGDGATADGQQASHTYAQAGDYQITLTVTDDRGATAVASQDISVAPLGDLAVASFTEDQSGGWGAAEVGGAWSLTGDRSVYSVSDGMGHMTLNPRVGPTARLPIESIDTDMAVTITTDKAPVGGSQYFSVIARGSNRDGYAGRVFIDPSGRVNTILTRISNWGESPMVRGVVSDTTYEPGKRYRVRVQAFGTNPTTVRMKVWPAGTSEPEQWALSTTDSTVALQTAGGVAVKCYLSGAATNGPVRFSITDLVARPAAVPA